MQPRGAKRIRILGTSLAAAAFVAAALVLAAETRPPDVHSTFNVLVAMRDDVKLAANVFLPAQGGKGKHPVILIRTPYGKDGEQDSALYFAANGYAVVVQDTRGRNDSDGEWYAFKNEADDGHDSIEWAARQTWSNGKVATMGGSYLAIDQWLAATRASSHLAAMIVFIGPSDLYTSTFYPGGAFLFGTAATWSVTVGRHRMLAREMALIPWPELFRRLPVESAGAAAGFEATFYRDWIEHPSRDDYWKAMSWQDVYPKLNVPVMHIGGWYDIFQEGTIENFARISKDSPPLARQSQRMVLGPWAHGEFGPKVGEVDFGPQSVVDVRAKNLRWLDHYVRGAGNGAEDDPPIEYFVMGVNEWKVAKTWPPPDVTPTRFFLRSGGKANAAGGDGTLSIEPPAEEPADRFDYDPGGPVPTTGGGTCCNPQLLPWGAMDQRGVESRQDVLVYSSAPLERDLEVTGPVEVHLLASTSGRDTDWTVKIVDAAPDGPAINVTDGILRARYRNSFEKAELLEPGKVYEFVISAGHASNVFRQGHRIRLEVSSSNFPRFSRNTNTGNSPEKDRDFVVARQTVYHHRARASYVSLPVRTAR